MKAEAILVIVLLAAGASVAVAAQGPPVLTGGKAVYDELCGECHGSSGKGDGPGAPPLRPRPADLTAMGQLFGLEEDYLREIIQGGGTAVGKSALMPALWGAFAAGQVEGVCAYVRTLAGTSQSPATFPRR